MESDSLFRDRMVPYTLFLPLSFMLFYRGLRGLARRRQARSGRDLSHVVPFAHRSRLRKKRSVMHIHALSSPLHYWLNAAVVYFNGRPRKDWN